MDRKKALLFIKKGKNKEITMDSFKSYCEKNDECFEMIYSDLLSNKHIIPCVDDKITLTPDGEEYLNKHSWLDKKQILPIIIAIFALLLSAGGVWLSNNSLQVQIDSLTPKGPVLTIYPDDNMRNLYTLNLIRNISDGEKIRLYVQNTGSVETQKMTIELISPKYLKSNKGDRETIAGSKTDSIALYIKKRNCDAGDIDCTDDDLPVGIVPLTFEITCRNCDAAHKKFNETIDFCIYKKDISICTI